LPGEAAYALAMRSQEECFEIPDDFVRDKLEELADPAAVAARATAAGIESKYVKCSQIQTINSVP